MKTLKISDELHYRLKVQAAALGINVQDLADQYLTASQDAIDALVKIAKYQPAWSAGDTKIPPSGK